MTIVNSNRCVQPSPVKQWSARHESNSVALAGGCVSMDASALAAVVNELFAVGLDLAAVRSVAASGNAERIDRAIDEIDAIISTIRLAALPPDPITPQRTRTRDTCV